MSLIRLAKSGAASRLSSRCFLVVCLTALACGRSLAAGEAFRWDFDRPSDVLAHVHFEPARVADGKLAGETAWDPYFCSAFRRNRLTPSNSPG